MTMSDEAYAQMCAYESNERSIRAANRETSRWVVKLFVNHLFYEHSLGYRQIGKRLGLKWTDVKTIINGDTNDQSKR